MTSRSKNDSDYDYLFKILIIGDSGVGYVIYFSGSNSQMILYPLVKQRFCNDLHRIIFLMNTSRQSVLVRASFLDRKHQSFPLFQDFQIKTLDIDSKRCKVQVWDTAGQDRFKCVVGAFYRNANGVIICFDLTDIRSFRNITRWYDEVLRYCPDDTQVFLVGTKSDLKTRRVVSPEMIRTFTEQHELTYIETSSKANENVEKCFIDFTRKLLEYSNSLSTKSDENDQPTINIGNRTKPVHAPKSGSCFGDGKCTI